MNIKEGLKINASGALVLYSVIFTKFPSGNLYSKGSTSSLEREIKHAFSLIALAIYFSESFENLYPFLFNIYFFNEQFGYHYLYILSL